MYGRSCEWLDGSLTGIGDETRSCTSVTTATVVRNSWSVPFGLACPLRLCSIHYGLSKIHLMAMRTRNVRLFVQIRTLASAI